MTNNNPTRIDEISTYYDVAKKANTLVNILYLATTAISLSLLFSSDIPDPFTDYLQTIFVAGVVVLFFANLCTRLYLIPRAEKMRRKQMLSDAFDTSLILEKTSQYYNNEYAPSIMRLGANAMENSYFSKEITSEMLKKTRLLVSAYLTVWFILFTIRETELATLIWITQVVFSGEVIAYWFSQEVIRFRFESVYEQLRAFFHHATDADNSKATATILDAVISYESAKASGGILLSTNIFEKLNPRLTQSWEKIRSDLDMV